MVCPLRPNSLCLSYYSMLVAAKSTRIQLFINAADEQDYYISHSFNNFPSTTTTTTIQGGLRAIEFAAAVERCADAGGTSYTEGCLSDSWHPLQHQQHHQQKRPCEHHHLHMAGLREEKG